MRHLIDFGDLPRAEWDALYDRASQIIDDPDKFIDVCRGKVYGDAPSREQETAVFHGGAHSFPGFLHGSIRQAYDFKHRHAVAQVHFAGYGKTVDADQSAAADTGEHESSVLPGQGIAHSVFFENQKLYHLNQRRCSAYARDTGRPDSSG